MLHSPNPLIYRADHVRLNNLQNHTKAITGFSLSNPQSEAVLSSLATCPPSNALCPCCLAGAGHVVSAHHSSIQAPRILGTVFRIGVCCALAGGKERSSGAEGHSILRIVVDGARALAG